MSETGFELRWGKGFEDIERRNAVRNKISTAIDLAVIGLEHIGVERETDITVNVKTPGPDDYHASSVGYRTLNLFMREATLSKGGPTQFYTARSIVHETLHCLRWRTAYPSRLPERAACEGISYMGEYQFGQLLQREYGAKPPRRGMIDAVKMTPKKQKEELKKEFINDVLIFDSRDANSWDWWLSATYGRLPISRAEVVGIHSAQQRLQEGYGISDLLKMSTAEVLGVA